MKSMNLSTEKEILLCYVSQNTVAKVLLCVHVYWYSKLEKKTFFEKSIVALHRNDEKMLQKLMFLLHFFKSLNFDKLIYCIHGCQNTFA